MNSKEKALDELTCPVLYEHLTKAVTLIPCGHKIQEEAAIKIYGPVQGWTVQYKCPVCVLPVREYIKDYITRNVVAHLTSTTPDEPQDRSLTPDEHREPSRMMHPQHPELVVSINNSSEEELSKEDSSEEGLSDEGLNDEDSRRKNISCRIKIGNFHFE